MTRKVKSSDKWKQLPWKKFRRIVTRLQCRIYKAQKVNDIKRVKRLQRLLLNSFAAKYLAVRQVTQLNTGRKTAGVDGKTALTHKERLELIQLLHLKWKDWKHRKLRRVWIPKPNGEFRGLGIPTIADRAYQCLIKYALDPVAEATFSARSYGFRPGRSAHDAQKLVFDNLKSQANGIKKRILEMDIAKCFDEIDHDKLMSMITLPRCALLGIWRALRAGVKCECGNRDKGTPQGGVISPLLANIALNGLEDIDPRIRGIRYADDAVFILKPGQCEHKLREKIDKFLFIRGLKVKEAKTQVVKATEGFDFLGWNFRVRPSGKFISTPSRKNYVTVKKKILAARRDSRVKLADRPKIIARIVRGWRNYHRYCDMSRHDLWSVKHSTWKFFNKHKSFDRNKTDKAIKVAFPKVGWRANKHVMVKGEYSPYNGDLHYWSLRAAGGYQHLTLEKLKATGFHCVHCGWLFNPEDTVELHHVDGDHNNWKWSNLEALHRECHQAKHYGE